MSDGSSKHRHHTLQAFVPLRGVLVMHTWVCCVSEFTLQCLSCRISLFHPRSSLEDSKQDSRFQAPVQIYVKAAARMSSFMVLLVQGIHVIYQRVVCVCICGRWGLVCVYMSATICATMRATLAYVCHHVFVCLFVCARVHPLFLFLRVRLS